MHIATPPISWRIPAGTAEASSTKTRTASSSKNSPSASRMPSPTLLYHAGTPAMAVVRLGRRRVDRGAIDQAASAPAPKPTPPCTSAWTCATRSRTTSDVAAATAAHRTIPDRPPGWPPVISARRHGTPCAPSSDALAQGRPHRTRSSLLTSHPTEPSVVADLWGSSGPATSQPTERSLWPGSRNLPACRIMTPWKI